MTVETRTRLRAPRSPSRSRASGRATANGVALAWLTTWDAREVRGDALLAIQRSVPKLDGAT